MNTWKIILATLIIFAAGVVTGGLFVKYKAQRVVLSTPPEPPLPGPEMVQRRFQERMVRELNLDAGQQERLDKVFADSRERIRELYSLIGPEMKTELREVHDKIRNELTEEQKTKFELLLKSRSRKGEGGPSGEKPAGRDHRDNKGPKTWPKEGCSQELRCV